MANGNSDIVLSIVVPVYNVERYLGKCLDSLLSAGRTGETEIILVDDGSTDGSGGICDSYAEKYSFIKSFHKQNGGLSDARNHGLSKVSGRFVFFCDSDDMVTAEGMDKIIEAASKEDADVILWDANAVNEKGERMDSRFDLILDHSGLPRDGKVLTGTDAMTLQIRDHNKAAMMAMLCAVKRKFILDNGLVFGNGLLHEDELWTPKVMLKASKVIYIPEKIYCYRIREDSIMGSASLNQEKHACDFIHVMNTLYSAYSGLEDDESRKILLANWADTYMWAVANYGAGRYECRREVTRSHIFKASKGAKSRLKAFILLLFGVKFYCALAGKSS